MGKKRCHFPPEGGTIGNAITRKCKLEMLTYITMDISVCPPEWYQSAKFRVLAHALYRSQYKYALDKLQVFFFSASKISQQSNAVRQLKI